MVRTVCKLTDGIGPSSSGDEDCVVDTDTLALANEVMQTLYMLIEKQVDTAGWFKKPTEH
jgi:hypothetical protein